MNLRIWIIRSIKSHSRKLLLLSLLPIESTATGLIISAAVQFSDATAHHLPAYKLAFGWPFVLCDPYLHMGQFQHISKIRPICPPWEKLKQNIVATLHAAARPMVWIFHSKHWVPLSMWLWVNQGPRQPTSCSPSVLGAFKSLSWSLHLYSLLTIGTVTSHSGSAGHSFEVLRAPSLGTLVWVILATWHY